MCVAGLLDAMRSNLPAGARIVWMCLENHADQTRRWAMSLERIVAEVNLSIETVVRSVRLLERHGIIRGRREGCGRRATVWEMLRSYEPSPHNGGIEPKETPQSAGMNGGESPHNTGIKQPKPPQSDGIERRGSRQNVGISNPAKSGDLTHQVSNPPKKAPPLTPPSGGKRGRGFVSGGIAIWADKLAERAAARRAEDDDLTNPDAYFPPLKIVEGSRG